MADRISNLPDEVICHILSFLPTEDVVATSVLSKRWKSPWLLVPTLDFDYQRYISFNNNRSLYDFVRFVYATIDRRGFHQSIKTFRLICDSPNLDVNIWLNAAMQQGQIESLDIGFPGAQMWNVPYTIFSSKTLVVLKLRQVSFRAFPSSVDLPSLKALHLFHLFFEKTQYILELLHGCPILEKFEANFVICDSHTFDEEKLISLPKLVRADLSIMKNIPMTAFSNVEFLLLNQWYDDITIFVFPNLIHLELTLGGSYNWSLLLDMLNHCPQLQTFVLNLYYNGEDWPNPHYVPECLYSQLRKCFVTNYRGRRCEMRFAKCVLQYSTSLRTMRICFPPNESHHKKLAMIEELTKCPRSSATCELLFK